MEQTPEQICGRMRKEVRYSALTTMSMRILKFHQIYSLAQQTAKKLQIKAQKNFSIIALRLSLLHRELTKNGQHSNEEAAHYVSSYLRSNLMAVLESKFCKPGQKNSEGFIEAAYSTNLKDIEVIERVLRTGMEDFMIVRQLLLGLFQRSKEGRHDPTQVKASYNLAKILCMAGESPGLRVEGELENSQQKNYELSSTMLTEEEICFKAGSKQLKEEAHELLGRSSQLSEEIEEMMSWRIVGQEQILQDESNLHNQGCVDWFNDI